MADKKIMTPEEKALLQARHRQEEAEARNRKIERDARTHRLVPVSYTHLDVYKRQALSIINSFDKSPSILS